MSNTVGLVLAGEGALWIQPDGPNTKPAYLGRHELGDLSQPLGDVKMYYGKKSNGPNQYEIVGSSKGAPKEVTTSMETDVLVTKDYMDLIKCPTTLFVHHISCGRMNQWGAWDRSWIMSDVELTKRTLSKITSRQDSTQDRAVVKYDITSPTVVDAFELKISQLASAELEDFSSIAPVLMDLCPGGCGDRVKPGDTFYTGTKLLAGSAGSKAHLVEWTDGATPGPWLTYPFLAAESIAASGVVEVNATTLRVIVARGTTDPANPAEVGITDDGGVTWLNVNVGAINAQYAMGPNALLCVDYYNVWLVTSGGYIYKSEDGGLTWTGKYSGAPISANLFAIDFIDERNGYAVGATNAILHTIDGGDIWSTVSGPAGEAAITVLSVAMVAVNRLWIGMNDGKLFYSHNSGTDWFQRNFTTASGGSIPAMDWYNIMVGVMIYNTSAPVGSVWLTINGGYDWQEISTSLSNAGLNDIALVDPTLMYAVGAVYGEIGRAHV